MNPPPRTPVLERDQSAPEHRSGAVAAPVASDPADDVSLFDALNALLRYRATIITLTVLVTAALIAFALLRPRTYTSTSSFVPESTRAPSSLSGLAAQFGVTVPTQQSTESSQFYVDLLRSKSVLEAAVETPYSYVTEAGPVKKTLVDVYDSREPTPVLRREAAVKRLLRSLSTSISSKTDVVTVRVSAPDPHLAQQVNVRLLALLSNFNMSKRQSRAREERRFSEQRLQDAKAELRVAEDRLQVFLERNRSVVNAPALAFQEDRLRSDLLVLRQLVTMLQQTAEQASMDAVRDTPVLTVVEPPDVPSRHDSRGLIKFGLLGIFLGGALGVGLALVRNVLERTGTTASEEFQEFKVLWREARSDLTHPWRLFARNRKKRASAA
jgi:uncharacterized protein involved in exopolysaccharide biosynthesis